MKKIGFLLIFGLCFFTTSIAQSLVYRGKILLVGDSVLFQNNLPDLLQKMAKYSGDSFQIESQFIKDSVVWNLVNHPAKYKSLLNCGNFLIIHENTHALVTMEYHKMDSCLRVLSGKLSSNATCTTPILLQNWGYKYGDTGLCKKYAMCCNFKDMTNSFIDYTSLITRGSFNYLPTGQIWQSVVEKDITINLHQKNGVSTANAGSYLICNALYDFIKLKLDGITTANTYQYGLNTSTEKLIRNTSKKIIQEEFEACENVILSRFLKVEYQYLPKVGDFFRCLPADAAGNYGGQSGINYTYKVYKNGIFYGQFSGAIADIYISDSSIADYTFCMTATVASDTCIKITTCKNLNQFYPYYHRGDFYNIPHFFYNDKNANCNFDKGEDILNFDAEYSNAHVQFGNTASTDADTLNYLLFKDTFLIKSLTKAVQISACKNTYLVSDSMHQFTVQKIPVKLIGTGQDFWFQLYQTSGWNPGYTGNLAFAVTNNGVKTSTAYIQLNYPDSLTFTHASITPNTTKTRQLKWNISLKPAETQWVDLDFKISSKFAITDSLKFNGLCDSLINDADTTNNRHKKVIKLNGSWDPNFKEVADANALDKKEDIVYTIYFQNTGTAAARNITVVDTLQKKCAISKVSLIGASHAVEVNLTNGILHFIFNDINLADSNANEHASHGFVKFSMRLSFPGTCDSIQNRASIYFDYNQPVITNNTLVSRTWPLGANYLQNPAEKYTFSIWPNPGNGALTIHRKSINQNTKYMVTDISGNVITSFEIQKGMSKYSANLDYLPQGLYFILNENGQCLKWVKTE
jgi:uncharacterized repeat protein (TIGR01451 family)